MTPKIDIQTLCAEWRGKIPVATLRKTIRQAAQFLGIEAFFEVTIVLADDPFIHTLNKKFRHIDKPTDVLSFPQYTFSQSLPLKVENLNLGDIILSYETIRQDALTQGKDFASHVLHMIVHGFLHLLGYDHKTDEEAYAMEQKEVSILEILNISDPYE